MQVQPPTQLIPAVQPGHVYADHRQTTTHIWPHLLITKIRVVTDLGSTCGWFHRVKRSIEDISGYLRGLLRNKLSLACLKLVWWFITISWSMYQSRIRGPRGLQILVGSELVSWMTRIDAFSSIHRSLLGKIMRSVCNSCQAGHDTVN